MCVMFGLEDELYDTIREKNVEIDKLKSELHDFKNKYAVLLSDYNDLKNQGNSYENFHCQPDSRG